VGCPREGRISEKQAAANHPSRCPQDSITISVTDEGYGIDAEDGQQIFNKFFRSTNDDIRQQVGHGLGLSLAKQIVMMHHGELDFESEPGKGSRFFIRLEKVSSQILDAAAS
jgi:signal transduction histidine kinase